MPVRPSRALPVLAALLLAALPPAPVAARAASPGCRVRDLDRGTVSRSLAAAIAQAGRWDRLVVRGLCPGTATIDRDLSVRGARAGAVLDGRGAGPVLRVADGVAASIARLSITGGEAETGGGLLVGAARVDLRDVSIAGNRAAGDGGGLAVVGGEVTLRSVVVAFNVAGGRGGGIWSDGALRLDRAGWVVANGAAEGGGIASAGALSLTGPVTVAGNTADGDGGGIHSDGLLRLGGLARVAGNTAGGAGGGIRDAGTLVMDGLAVVTRNTAGVSGGGIASDGAPGGLRCAPVPGAMVRRNTPDDCALA